MQVTKKLLLFLALTLFINACTNPKSEVQYQIGMMDFLQGSWGNNADTSNMFFEHWQKANDSTFIGHAYTINSVNDTLFQERVSLTERNGIMSYNPYTPGQNDNKEVPFTFKEIKGNEYWFVNEKHDFPKAIIYHYHSPDSITAWIEGVVFGEFRRQDFPMKKLK